MLFLEIYFSNMYLIVLETINQGTREHAAAVMATMQLK